MSAGVVTNIQRFCLHDGPGARTTVFLKGCPLRCRWCHNPETQIARPQPMLSAKNCLMCGACEAVCPARCHHMQGERFRAAGCAYCMACVNACPAGALEICGQTWDADALADEIARDAPFFGKDGGATLSGGEPTMQFDFCLALLSALRARGMSTCVETCGFFPQERLAALVPLVDLFLWDVKDTDPERHLQNTGAPLMPILKNVRAAAGMGARIRLRGIVLAGVNDTLEHADAFAALAGEIGAEDATLFPFHPYYSAKSRSVGALAPAMGKEFVPEPEKLSALRARLTR